LVPGVIDSLKAAWAAGTPTVEMGRLFGTTKSAIIGMVHRLGLDPRQSPIVFGPPLPPRRYEGQPRMLPPLESEPVAVAPRPVIAAPIPIPAPIAPPRPTFAACCWPIGEPGTKSFRFCEGTALPERPYCARHCAKAYIPLRQRAANAAAMGGD
jgi:GcrA cell cycle regulator